MDVTKVSFRQRLLVYLLILIFLLFFQSCSTNNGKLDSSKLEKSLSQTNFPAAIALAAYGEANKNNTAPSQQEDLLADDDLLCLLSQSVSENNTPSDNKKIESFLEKVRGEIGSQLVDDEDKEEIGKAIKLIKTGQFYSDIVSATKVSIKLLPQIKDTIGPGLLDRDMLRCPLKKLQNRFKGFVNNASISDHINNPKALEAMLRCTYEIGGAKAVAETARTLLDNDTVKLSIIAYARANGFDINERDLNTLRETALNTDDPELDHLVEVGKSKLKQKFHLDQVESAMQGMKSKQEDCKK